VPRSIARDDETPRRRRGAKAVAAEPETERGFLIRLVLRSPKDAVAGALAFAAISAIIANALFLQAGRHPAPMFGSSVSIPAAAATPANLLPRPRPAEADTALSESRPIEIKPVESRAMESKPAESKAADLKAADPLANLVKATAAPIAPSNAVRPPAPVPMAPRGDAQITGSHRVAAVQRVLTEYGYGQLKATGTIGADTQAAIQKFERDHKIPVTGQMSDRLVRDLAAMIGHPID
jgi:hypothetical protein